MRLETDDMKWAVKGGNKYPTHQGGDIPQRLTVKVVLLLTPASRNDLVPKIEDWESMATV